MCNQIVKTAVERAVGFFDKRDDGNPQHFEILVAPCECGSRIYARTPQGTLWVEAAKDDRREVDPPTIEDFARDVA